MSTSMLSKALDWVVRFLVVCISVWIVFYAFGEHLFVLLGGGLYTLLYSWISKLISLGVIVLLVVAGWYLYEINAENKK